MFAVSVVLAALATAVFAPRLADSQPNKRSVLDAAVSTARIHSFTEILRNSGIPIERLRSEDITLLVPIDISFYDLTPEQYTRLLSPNDRELAVKYVESHMVKGKYSLQQLEAGSVQTVNGLQIAVTTQSGPSGSRESASINGLPVFQADISGTNGYAHFIRGFLIDLD
jgi:uncharacterized surface protein with fasciclin (FAS1) repeats